MYPRARARLWSEGAVYIPGLGLGYGLKVLCVSQG